MFLIMLVKKCTQLEISGWSLTDGSNYIIQPQEKTDNDLRPNSWAISETLYIALTLTIKIFKPYLKTSFNSLYTTSTHSLHNLLNLLLKYFKPYLKSSFNSLRNLRNILLKLYFKPYLKSSFYFWPAQPKLVMTAHPP